MPIDLEKIGKFLKEKRELKGLTLVDVSDSLCLRKSLINAIESGSWKLLPHEVYVRGYLKEYAHLLNVYDEITDDFKQKEETKVPIEIPIQQKTESKRKQIPKRVFVYPLAFVLVIGFFILSQINKDQNVTTQIQYAERTSKNIIDNTGSDSQNLIDPSDARKLMITCQERTWVSVVIDDTEKKEFMLNPQDIIILNAKEKYDLLIGNAGGVKLILDGKDVQFTGISGEVKRIKLS
jgi:transcriptional regulator with XRE-family HTH domain